MNSFHGKYPFILIALIYTLANIIMLISPGVWWDDWTIFNPDIDVLRNQFISGGAPHLAALHIWLTKYIPTEYMPQAYHSISFISGALSLWMTFNILNWFKLEKSWVLAITLLVASSPLFAMKATMSCIQYYLCVPPFLLGVICFLRYLDSKKIVWRIAAFTALLSSLIVWLTAIALIPAFLIFMAIYVIQPSSWSIPYIKKIINKLISWGELFIIPIIMVIIRKFWFYPTGAYQESYAIGIKKIFFMPINLFHSFIDSTIGFLGQLDVISNNNITGLLMAVLALLIVWFVYRSMQYNVLRENKHKQLNNLLYTALFLYFPAILATSSVSAAVFNATTSRYQAMILIPVSIIIFWVVMQFRTEKQRHIVLGLIVGLSVAANITTQIQFQKSWIKCCAIAQIIKEEPSLQVPYTNVIVYDNLLNINEINTSYYVYTGISKLALNGDQTHFYTNYNTYDGTSLISEGMYNCKNSLSIDTFHYKLALNNSQISSINTIKLTAMYYINRKAFNSALSGIIDYEITEIQK